MIYIHKLHHMTTPHTHTPSDTYVGCTSKCCLKRAPSCWSQGEMFLGGSRAWQSAPRKERKERDNQGVIFPKGVHSNSKGAHSHCKASISWWWDNQDPHIYPCNLTMARIKKSCAAWNCMTSFSIDAIWICLCIWRSTGSQFVRTNLSNWTWSLLLHIITTVSL